nr:immunoglobulin light chain junction region [Macaca mulatta]MOV78924.1 immunoglobulin light chain junction region [Macaca mulatta]MOV79539.1 immunoglobulin light chain junction region [Macaca mulatta]
CVQSSHIPFTF